MAAGQPKLYTALAPWFHLLTHPKDYKEEAAHIIRVLHPGGRARPRLLELGSGGGNNAFHLKKRFECTLTDLSPQMLKLSKTINPECRHIQGDMRSLRLKETFDAVFIHDAIMYMTSPRDLARALATAAAHLEPGGMLLLQPDCFEETFKPLLERGGHDEGGRALRYVSTEKRRGQSNKFDMRFTIELKESDGRKRLVSEVHTFGLFPRAHWRDALKGAGFTVKSVTDPWRGESFLCRKKRVL